MMYKSIDPYQFYAERFDWQGFIDNCLLHNVKAAKIWLRWQAESGWDKTADNPYPQNNISHKWDLSTWSDGFGQRFLTRTEALYAAGVTPMIVVVDGATFNKQTWPNHPWKRSNNSNGWGTDDFVQAREAGPSGDKQDDAYMVKFWYPLVDMGLSILRPVVRNTIFWLPTSEPRQTWHPTEFLTAHLRAKGVPKSRIYLSLTSEQISEWRSFPSSHTLKRNIGGISCHGVHTVKDADAIIGQLGSQYSGIDFRPDSDGARTKDGNMLSGAGYMGLVTGMEPSQWKKVLAKYQSGGLLFGWHLENKGPGIWKEIWKEMTPLFKAVGGM